MDLSFLELVGGMLHPDPAKRLTLKESMEHNWMKGTMASEQDVKAHFDKVKAETAAAELNQHITNNPNVVNRGFEDFDENP